MSQPSVAQFFNTRKRPAAEDINYTKNKLQTPSQLTHDDDSCSIKSDLRTRSGRTIKRIGHTSVEIKTKSSKLDDCNVKQPKLVQFIKKGNLSPLKKTTHTPKKQSVDDASTLISSTTTTAFSSKESIKNVNKSQNTPVKQIANNLNNEQINGLVKKALTFDEVKTKVSRSAKLQELKASLNRIQKLEQARKDHEERNKRLKNPLPTAKKSAVTLKEFKTIELEVLTSPVKGFMTPTKIIPSTPDKNELMSPKRTEVSKRLLFSPSKDGSPSKLVVPPAYQRFLSLAESSSNKTALPLPHKYRFLIEMFKSLDSVCAMFYNRKEVITFKKLKPAVQRMMRKNFNESHLAQVKHLYPEAFIFSQMKMRNYGSVSKQDYFQLVIAPNVENNLHNQMKQIDENDVLKSAEANAMNPQVMTDRLQKFQGILLNKVRDEHDKFLKSLETPLMIPKEKVTRWHQEFDLENVPEIPMGNLPTAPNVEKYSSAKDILSTARNLFNCATPIERAMERLNAKNEKACSDNLSNEKGEKTLTKAETTPPVHPKETLLKGIPKSLLEKIRAKQAAIALDAITRRPSQDREATKYSRLPELARHLRNVFITEKKAVLTLEAVIRKMENSYRTSLTHKEFEEHLLLIAKECPEWIAFHEIRKTMYVKMTRDMDLSKIVEKLENAANEKSK